MLRRMTTRLQRNLVTLTHEVAIAHGDDVRRPHLTEPVRSQQMKKRIVTMFFFAFVHSLDAGICRPHDMRTHRIGR